jgi:histidinol-phosphate/aromatic aminotransferase/cobyric acid decarboxylase-like protein/GNAT superfamily N-acetyltransferase
MIKDAAEASRASGGCSNRLITVAVASDTDRRRIYRARYEIYGRELGQHPANESGELRDPLDSFNVYLVTRVGGELAGFISITPPTDSAYSIDKYFARESLPFAFDEQLYEVRLLTVLPEYRGSELATLLMYAAFRWIESHGGTRVAAIGREELLDLYERCGLERTGMKARCGAVQFELLHATVATLRRRADALTNLLGRIQQGTDWQLHFPFQKPAACFHGGAFFGAIGETFDRLERRRDVINADVLDAWFPPSPRVLRAIGEHLPWLLQTSPPTGCEGMVVTIADARGVKPQNVLPGGGSSDLIFRAFREWLTPASRALILDPTYGEYAHVLERVIGCRVDRFTLERESNYEVDLDAFEERVTTGYDIVVLVNPNSPTGRHIDRPALQRMLARIPVQTRVWVDETYIEYAGPGQSLERFAAKSENVIVCKSMSKVYALSGARAAYLCAAPHQLEQLRAITPPWVVSLPAQVAAVNALRDPQYYAARYRETARLRESLAVGLKELGWEVLPGIANFLLCHLPADGPSAASVTAACRRRGFFVRDAALMGTQLGTHTIRIAVKDAATNRRILEILREVCARHYASDAARSRSLEPIRSVQRGNASRMEPALEVR